MGDREVKYKESELLKQYKGRKYCLRSVYSEHGSQPFMQIDRLQKLKLQQASSKKDLPAMKTKENEELQLREADYEWLEGL